MNSLVAWPVTFACGRGGGDTYQIARNYRTCGGIIETVYATHIKNALDAAKISVRRPMPARRSKDMHHADDEDHTSLRKQ